MAQMEKNSSQLAEEYDSSIRSTIPYYDSIHREVINLARSITPQPRIWLDTGCGTGTMVQLALRFLPNTSFILTDPSPAMLNIAKGKLCKEGRVQFLKPLCTQDLLNEIDVKPDLISAIQSHHYLLKMERKRAARVCYDLLPDGGIYVVSENIRPFTNAGIEIGKRYWEYYQREAGKEKETIDSYMARFDKEYFPITVEEQLDLLRDTGFRSVELFWYSYMQAGFYCIK